MEKRQTNIILINGRPRVGKDTFVEFCRQYVVSKFRLPSNKKNNSYLVRNISTIDPVRSFLDMEYDIDQRRKLPEDRELLAAISDALDKHPENPRIAYAVRRSLRGVHYGKPSLTFVHLRQIPMLDQFKAMIAPQIVNDAAAVHTLLIKNDSIPHDHSNDADAKAEDYDYDEIIENDGSFEEFRLKAQAFCDTLLDFG